MNIGNGDFSCRSTTTAVVDNQSLRKEFFAVSGGYD